MGIGEIIFLLYFLSIILSALLSLGVGVFVFLKDPFSKINFYFFGSTLGLSIYAGGEALGIYQGIIPNLPEKYFFWSKINTSGGWIALPFLVSLVLTLTTKEKLLKNNLFLFYLWIPMVVIIFLTFFTDKLICLKEGEVYPDPFLHFIFMGFYAVPLFILMLFSLYKGWKEAKSFLEKQRLKYLSLGLGIPIFIALVFFVLMIILSFFVSEKELGQLYKINIVASSQWIGLFIIGLGILKYSVFVNYRNILETVFKKLTDLAIVVDRTGRIAMVNDPLVKFLGYTKEEIRGKKIEEFLRGGEKEWKRIQESFEKEPFFERKITLLGKEKKEISFLATFSLTKNEIIIVGKEIQNLIEIQQRLEKEVKKRTKELERAKKALEDAKTVLEIRVRAKTRQLQEQKEKLDELVKERTKELQKKIDELKKFQEIALGREYRVFQLKEEIERLKRENEMLRKRLEEK